MPYELVEFPDGYRVMTSTTGALHSTYSMPLGKAKAQMRALYANVKGEGRTHRENVLRRLGLDEGQSVASLSKATGVPLSILQEVYNRGIGAYKTNPVSVRMKGTFKKNIDAPMTAKLSKEQWAMARVYSFLDGNPKHDQDLRPSKGSGRDKFLMTANRKARDAGLIGKVSYANDGVHKLKITAPDGSIRRFGAEGYGDHIYWSQEEAEGRVPEGFADNKRRLYRARATKIKGDWAKDPYSPNSLAIAVLW